MLAVTDQPPVTEHTRFWLFFEVHDTTYSRRGSELVIRRGQRQRIKVEVDEAAYRKAHAEQCPEDLGDFTMPLDDHWWRDEPIFTNDPWSYSLRRTRGGFIDWDAPYPKDSDASGRTGRAT
jgi:hypothetical protein